MLGSAYLLGLAGTLPFATQKLLNEEILEITYYFLSFKYVGLFCKDELKATGKTYE